VYESEFVCDYSYHAQMEPLNSVASVSPAGDACEIWCGTQSQTMAVAAVAKALGIPVEKVKLNLTLLGGGFGRRGHRDEEFVVDSVLLSKEVKRPVKVLWTREDDVHNGRFRPLSVHFMRAGLDSSNRIVAWQHRVACDEVTAFQDPVRYKGGGEKDFLAMAGSELRTYDIPNRLAEQLPQETGIRTSSLRGIGFGPNKFATEAFLDEVAAKHGLDPVELRLQLLKNTPRGQAVIRAAVEMSDYRRKRPGRGLGFSFIDYAGTMVAAVAEVSIDKTRGKVNVHDFWLALDPGIAVQPDNVVAQTESSIVYGLGLALTERITIKDGAVAAVEHSRLRRAAHARHSRAARQADVHAEPSDGRGADGDAHRGTRHRERRLRGERCARAPHTFPARARARRDGLSAHGCTLRRRVAPGRERALASPTAVIVLLRHAPSAARARPKRGNCSLFGGRRVERLVGHLQKKQNRNLPPLVR